MRSVRSPTFADLVRFMRDVVHGRARIVHLPSAGLPLLASVLGLALRDRLLTADEYRAFKDGLADTDGPPTGDIRLSEWIRENAGSLGARYANELDRHFEGVGSD
jgi:NADH dehydrogenase